MRKSGNKDPNSHNKAVVYRIYPDNEQTELLGKTFDATRFVYNKALEDSMLFYNATDICYITPYARYKPKNLWLKEVDSLALANATLNLKSAYDKYFAQDEFKFSKKKLEWAARTGKQLTSYDLEKHPKFKKKRDFPKKYTTNMVNDNIALSDGYLKLPKVGLVKIKQHRVPPNNCVLKSVTVSMTASGKYFASVLYEYVEAIMPSAMKTSLGLDFLMAGGYMDSNGYSPEAPKCYRKSEHRLATEQRKLSRMVKGSNNYDKQCLKIAIIHEKISRQRIDNLHKESRKIANSYDLVGVEDINLQHMSKSLNFGKSIHDAGWGMFRVFLEYKLLDQGKLFIKIGKYFPSSKLCSTPGCAYVNEGLLLGDNVWLCPICGTLHDRDKNAAINIENEALRIYHERLAKSA